ncbi:MAG: oligoendopeptidase F [Bacteroidales bacterium]|nr:oligoendopeptidase F [Bacteroidales bacterium]
MSNSDTTRLPNRAEVPVEQTWDLSSLFPSDTAWEAEFQKFSEQTGGYAAFRGTLHQSAARVRECLELDSQIERLGDRLGTYAFLKTAEDVANSTYQGMKGRYLGVASRAAEAASFLRPELLAIPDDRMQAFMADPVLADYRLVLERLLRYKPHTLSESEERLLAMQIESAQTPRNVFDQLTNADMKFGTINVSPGQTIELSHGSFAKCLESPDRAVRRQAFHQYYQVFTDHENTLSATLAGSIKQGVYQSRVRSFSSARSAALFPDVVPESVYDNLITAVRANLPAVHEYYQLRRRVMQLPDIHMYDVYVPILSDRQRRTEWEAAVDLVIAALKPLGQEYSDVLTRGLRGRWCDRYENKGKLSGAFSSGCYDSDPYIMMNYQPDVLDHVFTLAHEAGHSMHTHLSKSQPYQYSQYTIFVAEVASTFNEQLLGQYMMSQARDDRERAYYINREIDEIRKTIIRQTMFAEFEKITHELAEANQPLTLDVFRSEYRKLLDAYFGPEFIIDAELELECLRIPHFYRAFYVYKYSTGLAAAIALAERVRHGGQAELAAYLGFLRAGCSQDPLDLLRSAGVDMTTPAPVNAALSRFSNLVQELDTLLT